jgi:acyl-CoA thioesterase
MKASSKLKNIFGSTHGGALFGLMDEAFQLACNSHGVLSVALNVNITYAAAPSADAELEAVAREAHITRRTSSYLCEIREIGSDKLLVTAQALAYRTGKDVLENLTD